MNNLKTILAILLTAVVICAMALLPQTVGEWSDRSNPGMAPIQPIQLTFHEDTSMLRKLALAQRMTTIPISPDSASMTEEEVLAVAWEGLDIYMDAGILDKFDPTYQSAEPYLGIDPNDKNNHIIFWSVTINQENQQSVFLHIDDDTGKILLMIYDNYEESRAFPDLISGEDMMERLIHAFLSPLSLMPSEVEWSVATERGWENEGLQTVYTYQGTPYGNIRVGFVLSSARAYVYFIS